MMCVSIYIYIINIHNTPYIYNFYFGCDSSQIIIAQHKFLNIYKLQTIFYNITIILVFLSKKM